MTLKKKKTIKKKAIKKTGKKAKLPVKKVSMRNKIDVEQVLMTRRELFLQEGVNNESILRVIKTMRVLDAINHKPIVLWICSGGGSVADGLALINTMRSVISPVITIVNSRVCSMGAHISIAGDKRIMYDNGTIMFHDMTSGIIDYSLKIKDRADFLEKYYKMLENNMRKYTKLPEKLIKKARTGEVWLFAEDCKTYEVVDQVLDT